ncbi:MAG: hydrogenase maturation nickel metallochaperone HypA [Thermoflexales bacterium]|nr:hydrogenase maturation nickel metallochaperone HypA [Thermoflexales bacterium]
MIEAVAIQNPKSKIDMHEVSVMQSALEIALEHMRRQNAARIHRIHMRVGALSSVVPEALEFAFDVVTHGTPAEGATLEIERVPAVCRCPACQIEFEPDGYFYECPQCGSLNVEIRRGRELELAFLEVS